MKSDRPEDLFYVLFVNVRTDCWFWLQGCTLKEHKKKTPASEVKSGLKKKESVVVDILARK